MNLPTGYQYAKLGSKLEYLRGICSTSLAQTASLAGLPDLLENLPARRYLVVNVVEVLGSLLVQLGELNLPESRQAARPFYPMLQEMEDFLSRSPNPRSAYLHDAFAQRLIVGGATKEPERSHGVRPPFDIKATSANFKRRPDPKPPM